MGSLCVGRGLGAWRKRSLLCSRGIVDHESFPIGFGVTTRFTTESMSNELFGGLRGNALWTVGCVESIETPPRGLMASVVRSRWSRRPSLDDGGSFRTCRISRQHFAESVVPFALWNCTVELWRIDEVLVFWRWRNACNTQNTERFNARLFILGMCRMHEKDSCPSSVCT